MCHTESFGSVFSPGSGIWSWGCCSAALEQFEGHTHGRYDWNGLGQQRWLRGLLLLLLSYANPKAQHSEGRGDVGDGGTWEDVDVGAAPTWQIPFSKLKDKLLNSRRCCCSCWKWKWDTMCSSSGDGIRILLTNLLSVLICWFVSPNRTITTINQRAGIRGAVRESRNKSQPDTGSGGGGGAAKLVQLASIVPSWKRASQELLSFGPSYANVFVLCTDMCVCELGKFVPVCLKMCWKFIDIIQLIIVQIFSPANTDTHTLPRTHTEQLVSGREFVINCELDCMKLLPGPNLFILVVPESGCRASHSLVHLFNHSLAHSSVYAVRRFPQTSEQS